MRFTIYMLKSIFCLFVLFSVGLQAQIDFIYNPKRVPNTYRSEQNPYYWGNREGVRDWQQDVHYSIEVELDTTRNVLVGKQQVAYWNNSPDSLQQLYFNVPPSLPNSQSFVVKDVKMVKANGLLQVDYQLEQSSLRVDLSSEVVAKSFVVLELKFETPIETFSYQTSALQVVEDPIGSFYKIGNWYPKLAVYDAKNAWNSYPYLNLKSEGNFGTYDVQIKTPKSHTVIAGAHLQNKTYENNHAIHSFHSENVNDFAFVCGPNLSMIKGNYQKSKLLIVALDNRLEHWEASLETIKQSLNLMEDVFGRYAFEKLVVVDAYDSSTFPMMCMASGHSGSNQALLVYQVCRQWFFSMMSPKDPSSTYLYEGLCLYLTDKLLAQIDPNYNEFIKEELFRQFRSQGGLSNGFNYHYPEFKNLDNYGIGQKNSWKYFADSFVLMYQLEYVLGKKAFRSILKKYFLERNFQVNSWEDFVEYVNRKHGDLDCFFDLWMNGRKSLNYTVESVNLYQNSSDTYKITLKRKGEVHLPINVHIKSSSNERFNFYIPSCQESKVDSDVTVLNRWESYGNHHKDYVFVVRIPDGIKSIDLNVGGQLFVVDEAADVEWRIEN